MASPSSAFPIVEIAADILKAIEDAALAAHPFEACGLLIGRKSASKAKISQAVASPNLAAPEHRDRFEIDPALQFRYQRALRGSPERVIGHFHSHPNGRGTPSATDLAAPGEKGLLWFITAIADDGIVETRAFTLCPQEGQFHEWRILKS